VVDRIGAELGRALRTVVMCYDVEEIVLGGGVTQAGDQLPPAVLAEWERQRASSALARKLLAPGDGASGRPDAQSGRVGRGGGGAELVKEVRG
jgi:predicted NBD/HSP70 family sugar kinase